MRNKKKCKDCGHEMELIQMSKVERNYKLTYNVLSIEEVKSNEVIETFFDCPKCHHMEPINGTNRNFFTIKEAN